MPSKSACIVCGKPLMYDTTARKMQCEQCGRHVLSHACCADGHFVCDACHADYGAQVIVQACLGLSSDNPITIAQTLMQLPSIHMHGPEHHILAGAALLTAYYHAGGQLDLPQVLKHIVQRGKQVPGGTCGFWGACGAAISAGIFMSIVQNVTPLKRIGYGNSNTMTAKCLHAIGETGGPRCCKRNTFLAIWEAAIYCREALGISMALPSSITCTFPNRNRECLRRKCPFFQNETEQP